MPARIYSNTAAFTTLTGNLLAAGTTANVGDTTNWPTPGGGEVALAAIDYGNQALVEIVSYTGKTSTALTGLTRGLDGTSDVQHLSGARVRHVMSSEDIENAARINTQNTFTGEQTISIAGTQPLKLKSTTGANDGTVIFQHGALSDVYNAIISLSGDESASKDLIICGHSLLALNAIWLRAATTTVTTLIATDVEGSTHEQAFSKSGTLAVAAGTHRFYLNEAYTITTVRASVGTQPTGASVIVDVNKNGTTIYGTQGNRPTIAVSTNVAVGGAHSVTTLAAGDYLTVDVDQVGSTVAGADLVVSILLRRA